MNFASGFLKDIKGNSSINQFGSKIKNMSQSFVPENAKDMLASATNSISSAANSNLNLSNITGTSQSNLQRGQSSQKISNDSGVYTTKSPSNSSMSIQQQQQYQQQQSQYRTARTESATDQQKNRQLTTNESNKRSTSQPMNNPRQQPVPTPEYDSFSQQQQQQQQSSLNQIDQLELNALKDTNEALKSEVQRLSLFELKSKSLEKEAKIAKELKETNEKLESEVKELNKYRSQCQKLETEIKQLKKEKQADEERFRSFEKQSNLNKEKLEIENQNLKNKIRDLDKMIDEYEKNFAQFKQKEQSLEKRIEYLESELDRLTNGESSVINNSSSCNNVRNSNVDTHTLKLDALEQANRILEQELESLKHQQKQERDKVKEKMDLLQAKQSEKLKKLEDSNEYYREQLEKTKKNEAETVEFLQKQCDDLRQRVNELELTEHDSGYLEKSFNELKQEMKNQSDLLSEERRKLEIERKNFNELNADYLKLSETIQKENNRHAQEIHSYEQRIANLQAVLDRKEAEINELRKSKDSEINSYLTKLSSMNDENQNLVSQLKNINTNTNVKEDELNKQHRKLNELVSEYDKLRGQLKTYSHLESELVEVNSKNTKANERIVDLENKINEWERKYNKELEDFNNFSQQQQHQIKQLKQQLTAEQLKHENLNADFSLLKLEANKLESLKSKCDHLEAELKETRANKLNRLSEYEITANKFNETNEKYENEIKMLNSQITGLRNDMKIREQECRQLEKSIDSERAKAMALVKQLEELNTINTQLTMQNAEYKRRLVSLDLLTDECNQLRKNLTLMTIESESRKAEISTLNSQINILENTVKTLRDASEKHSKLEINYDTTSYELKKKHEDFKRLQQLHETVKKEQLETIELLEEKLRDVEKKTELQSLKHEEIMLELESIRAKRERLVPFCPKCSTQQIALYQPMQPTPPQPSQQQQQQPVQQQTCTQSSQSNQQAQFNLPPNLPAQPLLSISIPQQQISPSTISPSNMSPYQAIQAQAHLSHFQVITLPGKQSVTVECQTSPTNDKYEVKKTYEQYQSQIQPIKKIEKANASSQTIEILKKIEYKEVNTDPIDFSFMNKKQPPQPPVPPKPITKNQSVNVNFYEKSLEEKGVQSNMEQLKEKYYLYICKYSYDPFKNSPNDNPEAELPLVTGDYLYILNEDDEYGFYNGELLNGKRGLVPSNFVERVNIDSQNLNKSLQNIPKNVLSHSKFKECCNVADLGQVIIVTQQMVQKLNVPPVSKSDEQTQTSGMSTATVATSTLAISTSTVSTMTIAQPTQQNPAPPAQFPVVTKQTSSTKPDKINIVPTSFEDVNDTSIKIGLPYPNNLKVEKFSEKSIIVTWDPPSAPISLSQSIDGENLTGTFDMNEMNIIQCYNVYLNHDVYTVVNIAEDRVVIIDDVDLSEPNRVSIQAVVNKEISSKPQECTLLFGSNRSFAPSNLSVFSITQTSAIVSWWPSSSLFSHIISIDSIEHRTLKPGVYRFKLSGLLPDTSHLVIVTAQIPNHTSESSSNYAASVEFRTLPSKVLGIPQNLTIAKDPNEIDSYNLSWDPPVSINNPVSNGVPVGGYSIYLDGIRVHQILNPIASTVSLSSKLLFNGAKLLTVRTLSLDGNSESKDSQPIKLSKSLMSLNQPSSQIQNKVNEPTTIDSPKKKPEIQSTSLFGGTGNLIQNFTSELNSLKANTKNVLNDMKPQITNTSNQTQQQPIQQPEADKRPPQVTQVSQIVAPVAKKPVNPMMKNIPLVSDISKKKQQQPAQKSNIDTDADLYENFRNEAPKQPVKQQQPKSNVQNPMYNTPNIISTPQKKPQTNDINRNVQQQQQQQLPQQQIQQPNQMMTNKSNGHGKQNYRIFVALFDYDPYQMSPNQDSCSEELPFKEGQLIKIFGDQDDDGFFYGESNGRSGYIPCNMVQEVQDPNLISQLLNNEAPQNTSQHYESDLRNKQQTNLKDSSKSKTTKQSQPQQQHQQQHQQQSNQSFQPVNNQQQYNTSKPQPSKNVCTMIALYDYDPQSLSPNVDVDIELPFKTGDIITVIGDMDEDGFFMAELRGKRGLVPSNFLQPIQPQDQQYYNNLQQQQNRK